MSDTFTTGKGVTVAVDELYTDVYRDCARVLLVTEIVTVRTDLAGRTRCEIGYRVVMRDGARVTSGRPQRIDADRITDPKLYQLVTDPALIKRVRS